MFNELDNLPRLDAILNGKPIASKNHNGWQCGSNIGENNNRGDIISKQKGEVEFATICNIYRL